MAGVVVDTGDRPGVPMRAVPMPRDRRTRPPDDLFALLLSPLASAMESHPDMRWGDLAACDGFRPEHVLLGPWGEGLTAARCIHLGITMRRLVSAGLRWEHVAQSKREPRWFADTLRATRADIDALRGDVGAVTWTQEQVLSIMR